MGEPQSELEASYDRVAENFAAEFCGELERKPFDRELLDGFADSLRGAGRVCEIGCGPGQIARYLRDRGVEMCGIDLSREMVKFARRLNPDITFEHGDMLKLDAPDASLAGIICFYSIIHLRREDAPRALAQMHRALRPGGRLLVSFHGGEGELHRSEWYGKPVSIDVTLFKQEEMAGYMEAAGFEVERIVEREPYEFEYPTRRVYAFGRKPSRAT
ncbi:MAG TPA: class I SAM-dependent methyltransferase [Pyrinomonadaceae bacterium]